MSSSMSEPTVDWLPKKESSIPSVIAMLCRFENRRASASFSHDGHGESWIFALIGRTETTYTYLSIVQNNPFNGISSEGRRW